MEDKGSFLIQLYHQALVDPTDIERPDFEHLLTRFPYSQPLYFAFERWKILNGEQKESLESRAILFAHNASWLASYVYLPVEKIPVVDVEDDDYVPFEDVDASLVEEAVPTDDSERHIEKLNNDGIKTVPAQDFGRSEGVLETVVQESIGGGDYFPIHHQKEPLVDSEKRKPEEKREQEDISLYNDTLMPYSFRWWLHKTRLEYAETYQPFVDPELPLANRASFDAEELDRVVLDQQVRAHIIHLQSPEDKLSEHVKNKESFGKEANKVTEVIERFIREEPQIQPPHPENLNVENKARKSSEEQFDLVTETLANIYEDQAMYVKAIEVYKKLILNFPEKKSYFAGRIKELEEKLY